MNETFLPTLDESAATDASLVGHKAATLASLRQAGLDVPPGFVICSNQTESLDEAAIAERLSKLSGAVFAIATIHGGLDSNADLSGAGPVNGGHVEFFTVNAGGSFGDPIRQLTIRF